MDRTDAKDDPFNLMNDPLGPMQKPETFSKVREDRPEGDEIFNYPLVVLNMQNIIIDRRDPGYSSIDLIRQEGTYGIGLQRRRSVRFIDVFRGHDGREYIQTRQDDFLDTPWGSNPLFGGSIDGIRVYAQSIMTKYGLPRPGFGLIWEDRDGLLNWCRRGNREDTRPPPEIFTYPSPQDLEGRSQAEREAIIARNRKPRKENIFEELDGDIAEKFVHQWPKVRTEVKGLPESFEAVYASQWLRAFENAQNQTTVFEKTQSELADETGMPDYDWGDADDDSPSPDHKYIAGVRAGQKLGEILYEWRLCVAHGPDVFKVLTDREARRAAALKTAAFRVLWHKDAFKFACEFRRAEPEIATNTLADKVRGRLMEHRGETVAGLGSEAAAKLYPVIPSVTIIENAIRVWENQGFETQNGEVRYLSKKV